MLDELGKLQTGLRREAPAPNEPSTIGLPGRGHRPDRVLGRDAQITSREVRRWEAGVGVVGARRDEEWAPP
jgi:hypothetical protein